MKVLDQTRKLIALAVNNPSEEEARSAARKACVLIMTHEFEVVERQRPRRQEQQEPYAPPARPAATRYDDLPPDWETALKAIETLLADPAYAYGGNFLRSVRRWVRTKHHITPKQWRSVQNIRACRW